MECKETYGNLDNVSSDEVQVLKTAEDGPELPGGPAASLGGARGGGKGRVERVNVNGQVDGLLGTDAVDDALDDTLGADGVDLAGLDNLEAAVAIVVVIAGSAEGGADASVDVGVVGQETLLGGVVEVGAVVDGGHVGGGATKDLGLPLGGVNTGDEQRSMKRGTYRYRDGCQSESQRRGRRHG